MGVLKTAVVLGELTAFLSLSDPRPTQAQWQGTGFPVCTAAGEQQFPALSSDGAGGAIVTWQDLRASPYALYAQRLDSKGVAAWDSNGVRVCTASGGQFAPTIVADETGGAIIAWYDDRAGDYHIFSQRIDHSGVRQWVSDGVPLCSAAGGQFDPVLTSDGSGGAIVVWKDLRGGNFDIYAQRVTASGVPQWMADGVAVCTAPRQQVSPTVIGDGGGGALISWADYRSGSADVYVQHITPSGDVAPSWPADGIVVCGATGSQDSPHIVSDGTGGAIVAWADPRTGSFDIYATRVTGDGAIATGWPSDGAAVCTASSSQYAPFVASDDAHGAFVVWQDARNDFGDVYIQHMTATGARAPGWPANGVGVAVAPSNQGGPTVIGDGAGGALVTWLDDRGGQGLDVYAVRITANGDLSAGWPANGIAVCTATGDQIEAAVGTDGAGGAIIAWTDLRVGASFADADIYAQRITHEGVLGPDIAIIPSEFRVRLAYPNPSRGPIAWVLDLPREERVWSEVFDISGRRVRRILDGNTLSAGSHVLTWDGQSTGGELSPNGLYLLRVRTSTSAAAHRVVLRR